MHSDNDDDDDDDDDDDNNNNNNNRFKYSRAQLVKQTTIRY